MERVTYTFMSNEACYPTSIQSKYFGIVSIIIIQNGWLVYGV